MLNFPGEFFPQSESASHEEGLCWWCHDDDHGDGDYADDDDDDDDGDDDDYSDDDDNDELEKMV